MPLGKNSGCRTDQLASIDEPAPLVPAPGGRTGAEQKHREDLRGGSSDDAIDRGGYATLPKQGRTRVAEAMRDRFPDSLLLRIPGFAAAEREGRAYLKLPGRPGLLIPVRDPASKIGTMKIRADDVPPDGDKYSYFTSSNDGGPTAVSAVHVPLGTPPKADRVRLTEGPLKADVIRHLDGQLPTIAVPGVGSWRLAIEVLKEMEVGTVVIAFDADAPDEPHVARALADCFAELRDVLGLAVEVETWDKAEGDKAEGNKGLDDLLHNGKRPTVLTGDEAANAVQEWLATAHGRRRTAGRRRAGPIGRGACGGRAGRAVPGQPLAPGIGGPSHQQPRRFSALRLTLKNKKVPVGELDKVLDEYRQPAEEGQIPPAGPSTSSTTDASSRCSKRRRAPSSGSWPTSWPGSPRKWSATMAWTRSASSGSRASCPGEFPCQEQRSPPLPSRTWIGSSATRAPGPLAARPGIRDHFRAALMTLSSDTERRTEYTHTGWRQLGDGWAYLHGGGAIGTDEPVSVVLEGDLARFHLPTPPVGQERQAAIREASI